MNLEEFQFLTKPEARRIIWNHREDPSHIFALSYRGPFSEGTSLMATQIKILQKAKIKLPTFCRKGIIFDPSAYEQSSGEKAGAMKFADYQGERALDLTLGLGVDGWELSKRFKKVVALEVDPVLCEIAKHNYRLLGVDNVEIIEAEATEWLQNYKGEPFDLIYIDPSRREEKGKRIFQLHESSPNPIFLADKLLSLGEKVLLKGSPMLTLDENRLVLPCIETLTIQSVEGECKETLFEMKDLFLGQPYWKARFCRNGEIHSYETHHRELAKPLLSLEPGHYIYEPDVALYKAALVVSYMEDKFSHLTGGFTDGPGYYVSPELDESFPGTIWKFKDTISFKPKVLKKEGKKTDRIQLGKKGVVLYLDRIRQDYNLKMGGNNYWLFAKWQDKKVVMVGERVK